MNDSIFALIIFLFLFILTAIIVWPKRGLVSRLKQARRDKMRILSEDCLKFLQDCEYRKVPCKREDIQAAFSISEEDAGTVINHLQSAGLAVIRNDHIQLTEAGRISALQIVRIHRLLEKYMADETSLSETEWHPAAEDREHDVTAQEVEELAARLGNPVYDPHGDPIPTVEGEIPLSRGIPINGIQSGSMVKVLHIEDEPTEAYAEIVAAEIQPGIKMRILEKTDSTISFEINGKKKEFALNTAANITAIPLKREEDGSIPFQSLSSLKVGESGRVIGISKACRGQQRRRLMDLGVVPGSIISAEMKSTGGDPTAYNIRGALIALRKQQADYINIEKNLKE